MLVRITILLLLLSLQCLAQPYPQGYFAPPLEIPLKMVGNFAELRANHFHGGFDLRTENQEWKKVLAIGDGYVSRIKISGGGYGKALYITHPNGFVSVYAHLRRFSDSLESYIRRNQMVKEAYDVELFPEKHLFPVKKSEFVAWSGNTGSSSGPHLHFEIRDEKTEHTINPLLFGYGIPDVIAPILKTIQLTPLDSLSSVNGSPAQKLLRLKKTGSAYTLYTPEVPVVSGQIGIALEAVDIMNSPGNTAGLYSATLAVDGQNIFSFRLDRMPFEHTRYINSFTDYASYRKSGRWFYRLFVQPGNKLQVYEETLNRGIAYFNDDTTHIITITARDFAGNSSTVSLKVKSLKNAVPSRAGSSGKCVDLFRHDKANHFSTPDLIIDIPEGALYDDVQFEYELLDTLKNALIPTHRVHRDDTPVHTYFDISLNISSVPDSLREKAIIVYRDGKGRTSALASLKRGDFLSASTRQFGYYTIYRDTTPPAIVPVTIPATGILTKVRTIKVKIYDNLAGIERYKTYLDDQYLLMEHDAKTSSINCPVTSEFKGTHVLKIVAEDKVGNTRVFEKTLKL